MIKCLLLFAILLIGSSIHAQALVIGTNVHYPPLASKADKNHLFVGFEIDIMQAICQRIKLSCTFQSLSVSAIPEALITKQIDLAIAGIIIPTTPEPGFMFSLPYLTSAVQFIALKQSSMKEPSDLQDKTIGVRHGTLAGGSLFKNFALKLYHGNVNVKDFPSQDDLILGLNNKQIDAAFMNAVAADYWLMNGSGLYKRIGSRIPIGYGYAIMANLGQDALIEKINQALLNMMADGSYLAIYSRYF